MVLPFTACGETATPNKPSDDDDTPTAAMTEWSVYWYLCGSDLETMVLLPPIFRK